MVPGKFVCPQELGPQELGPRERGPQDRTSYLPSDQSPPQFLLIDVLMLRAPKGILRLREALRTVSMYR